MGPFLSLVTRVRSRPGALARCVASVRAQTCRDLEQVFIVDEHQGEHSGGNLQWANTQLYENRKRPGGQYVFFLDDDGVLVNARFVEWLKRFIAEWDEPEVVLLKSLSIDAGGKTVTLPARGIWDIRWEVGDRPPRWSGNGYCTCARADVFRAFVAGYAGVKRGGDWHYTQRLIDAGCRFARLDIVGAKSTLVGKGKVFEKAVPGWWAEFAKQHRIADINPPDDWRLELYK